jgi:hypothetical protein
MSPALPIPPTGKEVTLVGCVVVQIVDGKIVEEFEYSDYLGFLQQLGVVPRLGWGYPSSSVSIRAIAGTSVIAGPGAGAGATSLPVRCCR